MSYIVVETLLAVKFSSLDTSASIFVRRMKLSNSRRNFFLRRFQRLPLAARLLFLLFSEFFGLALAKITADSARQRFSVFHNNPKAIVFHVLLRLEKL